MTVVRLLPESTAEKLMLEFFDTHAYNEQADWRTEPLTDEDPDDVVVTDGRSVFGTVIEKETP